MEIPDSVESIGASAFSDCDRLSSVSLGSGLRTIGNYAFNSCRSLTAVFFKNGLENIAVNVFTNSPIQELDFPDSVRTLTASAINSGKNNDLLKTSLRKVHWPAGVRSIPDSQFLDFTALEEIEIPEGVTAIGSSTFYRCSALNHVVLPSSIRTIGARAFYQCVGLTELTMPRNVNASPNAFEGCDKLVITYS